MATVGYESYYRHQVGRGSGINVYTGGLSQRGHGIGGILSGMLRGATPMFKSVGKTLLNVGLGTLSDVMSGRKFGESLKRRGTAGGQNMLATFKRRRVQKQARKKTKKTQQAGQGRRKRPKKKKKKNTTRTKRTKMDILGNI